MSDVNGAFDGTEDTVENAALSQKPSEGFEARDNHGAVSDRVSIAEDISRSFHSQTDLPFGIAALPVCPHGILPFQCVLLLSSELFLASRSRKNRLLE